MIYLGGTGSKLTRLITIRFDDPSTLWDETQYVDYTVNSEGQRDGNFHYGPLRMNYLTCIS